MIPDLIGRVDAEEEAPTFFAPRVLTVEEPAGGEVIGFAPHLKLLVGGLGPRLGSSLDRQDDRGCSPLWASTAVA